VGKIKSANFGGAPPIDVGLFFIYTFPKEIETSGNGYVNTKTAAKGYSK